VSSSHLSTPHPPPVSDEEKSKPNLLAAAEGSPLLQRSEWLQHLPAVPGQPAVHKTRHPTLREDVWGWLRQHRWPQYHQGRKRSLEDTEENG